MIRSRVNAGLARAKAQGKRLGRRPVSSDVVERIRPQLATGAGILKTAKTPGIGTGTICIGSNGKWEQWRSDRLRPPQSQKPI
jgi:DNA invertase Pin-like site-specific DNA recombinase